MGMGLSKIRGAVMPWLWRGSRSREEEPALIKYPPVAAGIPAVPVEQILQPHGETLAKIRHLVEQESDWDRWYVPLIRRYAVHVHLLPASEYHHHRGAGGLLAHGLEVGLYTMQRAREKLYGMKLEPRLRRLSRPRWQYGCFLASLCHDVGKPLLMRVALVPESRDLPDWDERVWQPFGSDLLTWCREQGAARYWVTFRKRQARDHEKSAALVWDRVITEGDRRFLSEYDSELLPLVLSALHRGAADDHELGKLVLSADKRSVQEDLGRSNSAQDIGQEVGLPVMRIYGDAMLRLVREDVWRVNVPGGRLWYLDTGLYLVWPEGGRDIGLLLDRDEGYRGVPRHTQVMAEIMHEWGYVEETPGGSPFWWLRVEGVQGSLLSVKIREPRGLLEVLPPPGPGESWPYEAGKEGEIEVSLTREEGQSEIVEAQEIAEGAKKEPQSEASSAVVETSGSEELDQAGQDIQGDRATALERAGGVLRGCLVGTRRALWACVPAVVRQKLHRWQSEIEGETERAAVTLALCQELKEAVSALRSSVAAHGEQLNLLVEASRMLIKAMDIHYGGLEPMWVREITCLLCDGVPVSEMDAERIKRRFGGSGRIRDWFVLSEEGFVLGRLE